jgi:hypothetical protein
MTTVLREIASSQSRAQECDRRKADHTVNVEARLNIVMADSIQWRMSDARGFPAVALYLSGQPVALGTAFLTRCPLGAFIYLRDDSAIGPSPFTGPFLCSPLAPPYADSGGHHLIALSFYAELTVIEEPPRLCLHDPTQELGISLNFSTRPEFTAFFEYLQQQMTIVCPNLPGFFEIHRFRRSLPLNENYDYKKKQLKENLLNEPYTRNEGLLLQGHSQLFRAITDMIGVVGQNHMPKATADQVYAAIATSRDAMVALLQRYCIGDAQKATVWAFLIGLYPLEDFNPQMKEDYLIVKRQWNSATDSQLHRSRILIRDMKNCADYIRANCQQFVSVVVPHRAVLKLAFDVFMSILRIFHFIEKHFRVLKDIFRVFLWMYVEDIISSTAAGTLFLGPNNVKFDEDTLEAIIFWSIVYIFEAGETRRVLEIAASAGHEVTETISDFVLLLHPSMFRHLHQIGVRSFERLAPVLATHLSRFLPLCDCIDVWLAAAASPSFLEFTQFMLISALIFNFPNMFSLDPLPDQDLQPLIEQAFEFIDHRYLASASFVLGVRGKEMAEEKLRML